jgi:hypothetical protein
MQETDDTQFCPCLKSFLLSQDLFMEILSYQATSFFDVGIQMLVPEYNKDFNINGNNLEKYSKVGPSK